MQSHYENTDFRMLHIIGASIYAYCIHLPFIFSELRQILK